jgi:hypothetical protein
MRLLFYSLMVHTTLPATLLGRTLPPLYWPNAYMTDV